MMIQCHVHIKIRTISKYAPVSPNQYFRLTWLNHITYLVFHILPLFFSIVYQVRKQELDRQRAEERERESAAIKAKGRAQAERNKQKAEEEQRKRERELDSDRKR